MLINIRDNGLDVAASGRNADDVSRFIVTSGRITANDVEKSWRPVSAHTSGKKGGLDNHTEHY